MKRITIVTIALSTLVSAPMSASSVELALDFTGTSANSFQNDLTFGWSFSANQSIIVDALGFFDDEIRTGPDLHQDHLVSLWTIDGDLLAQTTITNASTPVASTAEGGEWLFNDIAPVVLPVGDYVIGAHDPACTGVPDCDDIRFFATATPSSLITFIEARDTSGNAFPSSSVPLRNDGYFGPNLRVSAIPVPAALPLMLTGLIGFGFFGRKIKTSKK